MGTLTPGATYIYERVNDVIYAREVGTTDRFEIGRSYDTRTNDGRPMHEHIMENKLWGEVRRAARTNVTLQAALDECIMIYKLSKEYKDGI